MLAHLLGAVLAQVPDAAPTPVMPWWWGAASGVSLLSVLAALWYVATYKRDLDRVKKIVAPEDAERTLGNRVARLEEIVLGDGQGNDGCARKHKAIEERLAAAPSKGSINEAFKKIDALASQLTQAQHEFERKSDESQRGLAVAVERFEGTARRLEEKFDLLLGIEDGGSPPRPLRRSPTNPNLDPSKGR